MAMFQKATPTIPQFSQCHRCYFSLRQTMQPINTATSILISSIRSRPWEPARDDRSALPSAAPMAKEIHVRTASRALRPIQERST